MKIGANFINWNRFSGCMQIKDLQPGQGNIDIVAEVIEKSDARAFDKFGQSGKVATATLKDATGTIKISLWNEQTDMVNMGDTIHISNGYVKEYKGEKQLTTGRMGKIEVMKKEGVYTNIPPKEEEGEDVLDDDDIVL